jgi:serine/threonine-protein kinase
VIDASTAELLQQFAQAKPITEAIIAFTRLNGSDPEETLVEAFPAIQRLINDGLLVLANSDARNAIEPSFWTGDRIDGFVVVDEVQVLQDSEVYRAKAPDGQLVAIKVARPEASGLRRALAREAAILRILDGTASPKVAGTGQIDDRAYLAVEWLEGRDVATAGHALLARGESGRAFELAGRLLDAYAAIHERGVQHGDVHPRNALVLHDGSVRLIDFGLADSRVLAAELQPHDRGGVGFFLEPEFARARLRDQRPPRVDAVGEQSLIAALVFYCWFVLPRFSPEKQAMPPDRRGGSAHVSREAGSTQVRRWRRSFAGALAGRGAVRIGCRVRHGVPPRPSPICVARARARRTGGGVGELFEALIAKTRADSAWRSRAGRHR